MTRQAGEARWQFLVRVLREQGPMTTGQLGHIYGIGENVRGVCREAITHLKAQGLTILSEPTYEEVDGRRVRRAWATYRLVPIRMVEPLRRTARILEEIRVDPRFGPRPKEPAAQGRLL